MLVGCWLTFRRNQGRQSPVFVVAVSGNRTQRIFFGDQATVVVVCLEVLCTVGIEATELLAEEIRQPAAGEGDRGIGYAGA